MNVEIRTATVQPIRNTFDHVAERIGGDKMASRYLEGTLMLQSEDNFHYRPIWAPEYELYDKRRTGIQMADWHVFRDPRQFYYGSYTIARARQQDAAERNHEFVEKRGLLRTMPASAVHTALAMLLPLRHYEWGANMNNSFAASYSYGSMINVPLTFHAMDRLGLAQYLTQIGLILGGGSEIVLEHGRAEWLDAPAWQGLRRLVEDLFVVEDWFEVLAAQNLVLDGVLHPLVYGRFPETLAEHGTTLSILLEFFVDWGTETAPWVDSLVRTAAAESPANQALLSAWLAKWRARVAEALPPMLEIGFGDGTGAAALATALGDLDARAARLGLTVGAA